MGNEQKPTPQVSANFKLHSSKLPTPHQTKCGPASINLSLIMCILLSLSSSYLILINSKTPAPCSSPYPLAGGIIRGVQYSYINIYENREKKKNSRNVELVAITDCKAVVFSELILRLNPARHADLVVQGRRVGSATRKWELGFDRHVNGDELCRRRCQSSPCQSTPLAHSNRWLII